MDQVKAAANFGFVEALKPWLDLRTLIRWAQGNDEGEIQGQGIVSVNRDQRQRVSLQVRAFAVEQEALPGSQASFGPLVEKVRAFPDMSLLGALTQFRLDAHFIFPLELPFHEVNARIKGAYLAETDLASAATDIQIVFDVAVDDTTTHHHQIGPMTPAQLNGQLLAFPREGLPDQFLFVAVGRTETGPTDFDMHRVAAAADAFADLATEKAAQIAASIQR